MVIFFDSKFRKPEVCERLKELSPIFGDNGGMTAKTAVLFIAAQVIERRIYVIPKKGFQTDTTKSHYD